MVDWQRAGLTATADSPHAALAGLPLRDITWGEGFWRPWVERNRTIGLPRLYQRLDEHGALVNLRRLAPGCDLPRQGARWTDSDLAKWLEGACYVLQVQDDPALREQVEAAVAAFVGAQGADGYLNSYFQDERFEQRFTRLADDHELYCAGHLFQAAVAHARIAGDTTLLDAARRYADYLVESFGPGRIEQADGHPEVELALIELYRATGERRYLDLAGFFLDVVPLRTWPQMEGHAVRALYFLAGGVDHVLETGDTEERAACERLARDLVTRKMYPTGAVGGQTTGERIGQAYELPALSSYAETCAAAANVFAHWRLLQLDADARRADVLELALYNGYLAGVGLDGDSYFYVNPHACTGEPVGDPWYPWARRGAPRRVAWFDCTCCPTNAVRVFASLAGYLAGVQADRLYLHLYDSAEIDTQLADGRPVKLAMTTRYPWAETVSVEVQSSPGRWALALRIPGWCRGATAKINGKPVEQAAEPGTYLVLERDWQAGDRVTLTLPMPPTPLTADPHLREGYGCVVLRRGPLIYCAEGVDNPGVDLFAALYDPSRSVAVDHRPDLLGGVTTLRAPVLLPDADGERPLYRPLDAPAEPRRPGELTMIPYFAWANRGPSAMTLWLPLSGGVA